MAKVLEPRDIVVMNGSRIMGGEDWIKMLGFDNDLVDIKINESNDLLITQPLRVPSWTLSGLWRPVGT